MLTINSNKDYRWPGLTEWFKQWEDKIENCLNAIYEKMINSSNDRGDIFQWPNGGASTDVKEISYRARFEEGPERHLYHCHALFKVKFKNNIPDSIVQLYFPTLRAIMSENGLNTEVFNVRIASDEVFAMDRYLDKEDGRELPLRFSKVD